MHRRGGIGITKGVVTLDRYVGHAPCALPAESHSLDAQLSDVIVGEIVLRVAMHGKARHSQPEHVHRRGRDEVRVLEGQVLREVVVKGSEAGQILRGKIPLGKEGIAPEQRVAMGQILVDAQRSLIGKIAVGAQVKVIVGVRPGADRRDPMLMPIPIMPASHIGKRHLRQLAHGDGADFAAGDHVIHERVAENGRIGRAGGKRRIVIGDSHGSWRDRKWSRRSR